MALHFVFRTSYDYKHYILDHLLDIIRMGCI